ncbi:hypothetical protein ACQZWC_004221, partial [Enterobacter bugandensis]
MKNACDNRISTKDKVFVWLNICIQCAFPLMVPFVPSISVAATRATQLNAVDSVHSSDYERSGTMANFDGKHDSNSSGNANGMARSMASGAANDAV